MAKTGKSLVIIDPIIKAFSKESVCLRMGNNSIIVPIIEPYRGQHRSICSLFSPKTYSL